MVLIVGFLDPTPIVLPARTPVNPTIDCGDWRTVSVLAADESKR
jgi:hypothetical protein